MPGHYLHLQRSHFKSLAPGLLALALSLSQLNAFEIQFSSAEGYPATPSPLNDTPASKPVWLISPNAFSVDGTNKAITANVTGEAATALLATPIPLAAGQTVAVSADFEFMGLDESAAGAEAIIHGPSIGLGTSSSRLFQNVFNILFGHFDWAQEDYTLQVMPGEKAAHFSASTLGLSGGGTPSDRLRFTLELAKGENPSDWQYHVILFNVTMNVEIAEFSGFDIVTSQDFYDSPNIYLNLNRGNSEATGGPAAVTFYSVKVE